MAAQNSGGQRGQRQESGKDEGSKNSKGQRGQRQEAGNDNSSQNNQGSGKDSGNSNPGRKDNTMDKSQKEHGA